METYVQALRVAFLMTVGFVVLNLLSGVMLEEHTLHDNLERRVDHGENDGNAVESA